MERNINSVGGGGASWKILLELGGSYVVQGGASR